MMIQTIYCLYWLNYRVKWVLMQTFLKINDPKVCPFPTYLDIALEPPILFVQLLSWQASISLRRMNKHSRNVEKKGWWVTIHNDVKVLFRTRLAVFSFRLVLGDFRLSWSVFPLSSAQDALRDFDLSEDFRSMGLKKFTQIPYLTFPESFSVSVYTKDVVSLRLIRFGPTLMHPSGWQKKMTSGDKGKSWWSSRGYLRKSSGVWATLLLLFGCRLPTIKM